jgi:hypothetical protein
MVFMLLMLVLVMRRFGYLGFFGGRECDTCYHSSQ